MQNNDADEDFIREEREVQEIRINRARAQEQVNQLEMMERMSKILPDLQKAQGNPMMEIAQQNE